MMIQAALLRVLMGTRPQAQTCIYDYFRYLFNSLGVSRVIKYRTVYVIILVLWCQ